MAKKRVYEVARELGIPSRDVVKRAQSLGLAVTTASSGLDLDDLARVSASYEAGVVVPTPEELSAELDEDISQTVVGMHPAETVVSRIDPEHDATDVSTLPPEAPALLGEQAGWSVVVDEDLEDLPSRLIGAKQDHRDPSHAGLAIPLRRASAELAESTLGLGATEVAETDSPRRLGAAIALVALMLVVANAIMRVSVGAGVVANAAAFATAVGFVIFGKDAADPDALPAESWLFAAMALVPTIAIGLVAIRPIPDWVFPVVFVVPVAFGVSWLLIALPNRRVAGLNLLGWRGMVWSLAVVPFVVIAAATSLGERDVYLGASSGATAVGRVLVLVAAALAILIVYNGLIQGLAEPLIGRAAVPWIAVVFASTFAASWPGLVFLVMLGLVLATLRSRFGSIWPGFLATVPVLVSLTAA